MLSDTLYCPTHGKIDLTKAAGCPECVRELKADLAHVRKPRDERLFVACQVNESLRQQLAETKKWIDDLQSGMYVNCVYCGHRYGPGETTPVSMADALKAHVESCPKHPMSDLKKQLASVKKQAEIDVIHARGFANKKDFEELIRTKNSMCNTHELTISNLSQRLDELEEAAQAVLDNDDPGDWPACYKELDRIIRKGK